MFRRKKPEPRVCVQCKVLYEAPEPCTPYPEYCSTHRAPHLHRKARIDAVRTWADRNWERLEPQMKRDNAKRAKAAAPKFTDTSQLAVIQQQYAGSAQCRAPGSIWPGGLF